MNLFALGISLAMTGILGLGASGVLFFVQLAREDLESSLAERTTILAAMALGSGLATAFLGLLQMLPK